MARSSHPAERDPEFSAPGRPLLIPPSEEIRFYQRLVVNPFLPVFVLCAVTLTYRFWPELPRPPLPIGCIICVSMAMFLTQFHCLDCGQAGTYPRWRRHSCTDISDRYRSRTILHGFHPAPATQLIFWVVIITFVLMVISVTTLNVTS